PVQTSRPWTLKSLRSCATSACCSTAPLPSSFTFFPFTTLSDLFLMSRKIILIKQELLLPVYELNRCGLLAENEKIRPILAQLEKLLLCDLSPSTNDSVKN